MSSGMLQRSDAVNSSFSWTSMTRIATYVSQSVHIIAHRPLVTIACMFGTYVAQYVVRKRISAAIFLIHHHKRELEKNASDAQTDESDTNAGANVTSQPQASHNVTLEPEAIRDFAASLSLDPRSDIDLVERLIAEVLLPDPPAGWILTQSSSGLRFCDLSTMELHLAHPECTEVVQCIRADALRRHGDPNEQRDSGSTKWKTSTIDDDRILHNFLRELSHSVKHSPDRHRDENHWPSWSSQSLRAAVTSIRDIVQVSARPEILKEAASSADERRSEAPLQRVATESRSQAQSIGSAVSR